MASRTTFAAALALHLSGCALGFDYHECNKDADCPTVSGQKLSCTSEGLCVAGTPASQLCTRTHPQNPAAGAVPIGAIMRLSLMSGADTFLLQAVQLGVDEVNSFVGAGQRPVALHICDSGRSPEDASKALRVLLSERKVAAVVGPSTSREALAVAKVAGDAQVPLVSPSATAASLMDLQQKDYVYKIAPSDNQQGPVLARLVKERSGSAAKVALIYVDDAYGTGLQGAVSVSLPSSPELVQSFKEGDAKTINAAIMAVKAKGSALTDVIIIANPDAAEFARQLESLPKPPMMGTGGVRIYMTDGAKNDSLLALARDNLPAWTEHLRRLSGTSPTAEGNAYKAFETAFRGKFGQSPTSDAFAPYAYDSFYALAVALGAGQSGPQVAAGLRRFTGNAAPSAVGGSDYLKAVGRMEKGESFPLSGVTGTIRFKDGSREGGLFEEWSISPTDTSKFQSRLIQ